MGVAMRALIVILLAPLVACNGPSAAKDDPCSVCPSGQGCGSGTECRPLCVADYQCGACEECSGGVCVEAACVAPNLAPLADAGPDQTVNKRALVTLDGTDSVDQDGDELAYAWTQTSGTAVTLNDTALAQPTFTAPSVPATLTFSLVVDDGEETDGPDTVTITVQNGAPVANAGLDHGVIKGAETNLDGSGSTDPDGDTVTYSWSQTGGTTVTLSSTTVASPTFTAPLALGNLDFVLTVSDGIAAPVQDPVRLVVFDPIPVARAGSDFSAVTGVTAQLDGTDSSEETGDPFTFAWTQVSGPSVTLNDATSATPTFMPPCGPATLVFSLVVTDSAAPSLADTVSVTVENRPMADAGSDLSVLGNEMVRLSAGNSCGSTLRWSQTSGPLVTLDDPTSPKPRFLAPNSASSVVIELEASFGGFTDTDTVVVTTRSYAGGSAVTYDRNPFMARYASTFYVYDMEVLNDVLFLGHNNGLTSLNINTQLSPSQIANVGGTAAMDIAVNASNVFAVSNQGLRVVEASTLMQVGSVPFNGEWAYGVAAQGSYVYAAEPSMFYVVDVSTPASPSIEGSLGVTNVSGVDVAGDFAYLAAAGIQVVDVTDPTDPTPRGVSTENYVQDLRVQGSYAFGAGSGFSVFDISDPDAPDLVYSHYVGWSNSIHIYGNFAYLNHNAAGVAIYDITNPTAPVFEAIYDTSMGIQAMAGREGYVYAAPSDSSLGLQIIDATALAPTEYLDDVVIANQGTDMKYSGGRIYVAQDWQGFEVFDAGALPSLVDIGGSNAAPVVALDVAGDLLYAVGSDSLAIIDVGDPATPVLLGTEVIVGAWPLDVVTLGERAYLADNNTGVHVIDVTDPTDPELLGTYPLAQAQGVTTYEGTVYALSWDDGVVAIDDSVMPPTMADSYDPPGSGCMNAAFSGAYMYLGCYNWQTYTLLAATLDSSVSGNLQYGSAGVWISGSQLWHANSANGFALFDLGTPTTPRYGGQIGTREAYDLVRIDRHVVLLSSTGLSTMDAEPHLATRYDHAPPGSPLTYNVGWTDTPMPELMQVSCAVSSGSCVVGLVNQTDNVAQVTWTTPAVAGDYEISIALGTQRYFLSTRDRISVP